MRRTLRWTVWNKGFVNNGGDFAAGSTGSIEVEIGRSSIPSSMNRYSFHFETDGIGLGYVDQS